METPPRLAGDTAVRRAAHLAMRALGDETVVLDLQRNRVYGLDAAGGRVLDLLRSPMRPAELAGHLAAAGPRAALDAELGDFLAELARHGLIESCDGVVEPAPTATGAAAGEAGAPPLAALDGPPRLLWHEDLPNVTNQVSPPQMITNPQCHP